MLDQQHTIKVKFNAGLAVAILVMGLINIGLGFFIGTVMTFVTGGICSLVGVLWLVNPALVKQGTTIKVKSPLGMTLKSVPYGDARRLVLDGDVLYFRPIEAAARDKVFKKSFVLDGASWTLMTSAIRREQTAANAAGPPAA